MRRNRDRWKVTENNAVCYAYQPNADGSNRYYYVLAYPADEYDEVEASKEWSGWSSSPLFMQGHLFI